MSAKYLIISICALCASIGAVLLLRSHEHAGSVRPNSVQLPKGELHLEGDPWSGYITARDTKFAAALKARGYNYTYKEEVDQAKRADHMTEGSIDFMVTTLGQYLKHRPAGQVVGMIDESTGADALVLNTKQHTYLKSVDQIQKLVREYKGKGKKPVLAYSGDSPSEELLMELTNSFDELKLTDFDLVPVDQSSTVFKKLESQEAQLGIIWEPDTSGARSSGYTVALSSKNVPHRILDIIVASNRIVENDPEAVRAFISEFYKARQWNAAHAAEFQAAIAADGQLKPEEAKSVLDGIYLFDAAASDKFLNQLAYPLDQTPISESVQAIAGIMALTDPSTKVSDKMWNGSFVQKVAADLH